MLRPDSFNNALRYAYSRAVGAESFGFKLESNGVLRSCQSAFAAGGCSGAYQDLTDGNTVEITAFSVSTTRAGGRAQSDNGNPLTLPCPALCLDGTTDCWPKVSMRELVISISGRARSNLAVVRSLEVAVRVRNDGVNLSAPGGESCPAS